MSNYKDRTRNMEENNISFAKILSYCHRQRVYFFVINIFHEMSMIFVISNLYICCKFKKGATNVIKKNRKKKRSLNSIRISFPKEYKQ